jgi:predicted transcriptional regulator
LRRSKLEIYEAILAALARRPLKVDSIAYKTTMECAALMQYLNFLMKNGLIEERFVGDKKFYAITDRGKAVFKVLNFQRYLEKIAKSIITVNEVLEAVPPIPREDDEKRTENEVG